MIDQQNQASTLQPWRHSVIASAALIAVVGLSFMVLIYRFKSIDGHYAEMETRLTQTTMLMGGAVRQQTAIGAQLDRMEAELASVREQVGTMAEKLQVVPLNPAELSSRLSGPGELQSPPATEITMPPDVARAIRDRVFQRDITKRTMGKRNWKTVAKPPAKVGDAMPRTVALVDLPPDVAPSSEFAKYLYSIDMRNVLIVDPKTRTIVGVSPYTQRQ
jgi:hypothetical protein